MKMKPEHYNYLRDRLVGNIPASANTQIRWDMLNALVASQWVCDNLYPYLNDNHIDTALKAIARESIGCAEMKRASYKDAVRWIADNDSGADESALDPACIEDVM